jgi:dipeptidyl aminopeptidase/acylaminoacyl peptidase
VSAWAQGVGRNVGGRNIPKRVRDDGLGRVLAALALLATAAPAGAQDMAALFGAREVVSDIDMSPDGTKIAYQAAGAGRASTLYVIDLTNPKLAPKPVLTVNGDPEKLDRCDWAGNARLICTASALIDLAGQSSSYSRIFAFDADGRNVKVLRSARGSGQQLGLDLFGGRVIDWSPERPGNVLIVRRYVPEQTTGSRMAQTRDGLGVDLVDTVTLRADIRETPEEGNATFISDGHGHVRIRARRSKDTDGYDRQMLRYQYRRKGEREWRPLSEIDALDNGFHPIAVDERQDVAFGLKRIDGRYAAVKVALDGSLKEETVYAHPSVDVSGYLRIGPSRRVIGVTYETDIRQVHYLDRDIEGMAKALAKALPKLPLIRVIDTSDDESKMIVWAGSDVDPGIYYVFDRKAGSLTEFVGARNGLEKVKMAPMRAITYTAADGTMVPAYLTLPPDGRAKGLPALVMPHGGPSSRDTWGFDWLVQYFASQGYAVLQPNFRGSAGYGDAWFQQNGFVSWKTAIGDVNDAGRWLVKEGIADPNRLGIFGWSYGGYAALQSGVVAPDLFKAIVAVAPVTDLERLKEDYRFWTSYANVVRFVGTGAHIAEGSPARHAEAIKVPVLMFHGDADENVQIGHGRLMQSRLQAAGRPTELIVYKGLDHYLDDSTARTEMLRRSKAHFEAAFGK